MAQGVEPIQLGILDFHRVSGGAHRDGLAGIYFLDLGDVQLGQLGGLRLIALTDLDDAEGCHHGDYSDGGGHDQPGTGQGASPLSGGKLSWLPLVTTITL